MTGKTAIALLIILAVLFVILLAALIATLLMFFRKRERQRKRLSLLNLPRLSPEERKMFRKGTGHTGSAKNISTASPESAAKIIKRWLGDKQE